MTAWRQWVHGTTPAARPLFRVGDEVRVWYRILEQEGKERLGQFQGIVIRLRGSNETKTFTVRRVTQGEGVERVFPVDAKTTAKIELIRKGKVHRSRLYYLRGIIGKTRIAAANLEATASTSEAPSATHGPAPERPEDAVPDSSIVQ